MSTDMDDLIARLGNIRTPDPWSVEVHPVAADAIEAIRKLTTERDEWEAKANELSEWGNDLAENYDSLTADLAAARQALAEAREAEAQGGRDE